MNEVIGIELQGIDNASNIIAGASDKISASLKLVENASTQMSDAVAASVTPLNNVEQAQMSNASAAVKLRDAQTQFNIKQRELNEAISTYGANSAQAATKLRELNAANDNLAAIQPKVSASTKEVATDYKGLVVGISGVATASFALYNAWDQIGDKAVDVSRSNLAVKQSANQVEDAQARYNAVVGKYGAASDQAVAASKDLQLAQERYGVTVERNQIVQGDYDKTVLNSALSVIPTMITMVASLSQIKTALGISTSLAAVAQTALSWVHMLAVAPMATLTAAQWSLNAAMDANPVGAVILLIVGLVAALVAAYNWCEPFKNAVDALGKALGEGLTWAVDKIGGALTWLWENILKPIADFLGGAFLSILSDVGKTIMGVANLVGGALAWLDQSIQTAFGTWDQTVVNSMYDQVAAVQKGMEDQLAAVQAKTEQLISEENAAYDSLNASAIEYWGSIINPPTNAWDELIGKANEKYDQQIGDLETWASEERDRINAHYDAEIEAVNTAYAKQIADANAYYDGLIAVTQAKLDEIQQGRTEDLAFLEAHFLFYKQQIEASAANEADVAAQRLKTIDDTRNSELGILNEKYSAELLALGTFNANFASDFTAFWQANIAETTSVLQQVTDAITAHYDNEISTVRAGYSTQISDVNQFYSDLQAATNAGLTMIRAARTEDMDNLELAMLTQKQILEDQYAAGTLSKEAYEAAVSELTKKYNAERSALSDDYRLKELTEQERVEDLTLKNEAEKAAALLAIANKEAAELSAVEAEKQAKLLEMQAAYIAQQGDLQLQKAADALAIETKYKADVLAINAEYDALELAAELNQTNLREQGVLSREEKLKQLEDQYGSVRSEMTEGYRLKELVAEGLNNKNIAAVNEERNAKVSGLVSEQNAAVDELNKQRKTETVNLELLTVQQVVYLNQERNRLISEIRNDQNRLETTHAANIRNITLSAEQEQINIIWRAEQEKQNIIAQSLANIEAMYAGQAAAQQTAAANISAGITASNYSNPQDLANAIRAQAGDYNTATVMAAQIGYAQGWNADQVNALIAMIPQMADGGIVTSPTLALIGEGGKKEAVIPLDDNMQFGNKTFNITVNILGNADEATARRAGEIVMRQIQRVIG